MPRTKEYNHQDVLEKATYLFWEKGYQATSMADLVKVTKLNSASLYKEFGDKDGLFEAAIQYYSEHIISVVVKSLIDEPNIKGIGNFLEALVQLAESKEYMGCLVMNHLPTKDEISQKANQQICDFCTDLEFHLQNAIKNAQSKGEISSKKNASELASYIAFCVHGLILYGKHPDKKGNISNLFKMVMSTLN